jgi:hypothetical protein
LCDTRHPTKSPASSAPSFTRPLRLCVRVRWRYRTRAIANIGRLQGGHAHFIGDLLFVAHVTHSSSDLERVSSTRVHSPSPLPLAGGALRPFFLFFFFSATSKLTHASVATDRTGEATRKWRSDGSRPYAMPAHDKYFIILQYLLGPKQVHTVPLSCLLISSGSHHFFFFFFFFLATLCAIVPQS